MARGESRGKGYHFCRLALFLVPSNNRTMPAPAKKLLPSPNSLGRHMTRWLAHKTGVSLAKIAEQEGVDEKTVMKSLQTVERSRFLHTIDFANEAVIEAVVDNKHELKQAVREGLTATTEVIDNETNERKRVPDIDRQLKAVGEVRQMVTGLQKKESKPISITQQMGVAVRAGGTGVGYVGVEDRIRKIREGMKQLPEAAPTVVAPPEEGETDYSVEDR